MIAECSVSDFLDGHRYTPAVRFQKLMYNIFQRLACRGFQSWIKKFLETNLSVEEFSMTQCHCKMIYVKGNSMYTVIKKNQLYSAFIALDLPSQQ